MSYVCSLCYYIMFNMLLCLYLFNMLLCLMFNMLLCLMFYMLLCLYLLNMLLCLSSEVAHEDVPHRDEVADAAGKNKEMEDSVHVATTAKGVEQRTGDIAHTLSDDPDDRRSTHGIDQRLEGDEHTHAHTYIYKRLHIAVSLELMKTRDRAHDGAEPYKAKQWPAPVALLTQSDERDR